MLSMLVDFLISLGLISLRFAHTSHTLILVVKGDVYTIFVLLPSSTLSPINLSIGSLNENTCPMFGKEWTAKAFSTQGLGFDKSMGGCMPSLGPCLVRISLQWGEQCTPVMMEPMSSLLRALELDWCSLTFHRQRMSWASPVARTLGLPWALRNCLDSRNN